MKVTSKELTNHQEHPVGLGLQDCVTVVLQGNQKNSSSSEIDSLLDEKGKYWFLSKWEHKNRVPYAPTNVDFSLQTKRNIFLTSDRVNLPKKSKLLFTTQMVFRKYD